MRNGTMVVGREQIGIFDLYTFTDRSFGLANDGRIIYFQERAEAVHVAVQARAAQLWAQALVDGTLFDEYDVGVCQVILYADNMIGVFHAGDDRSYMVSRFFDNRADAEAYAREINGERLH